MAGPAAGVVARRLAAERDRGIFRIKGRFVSRAKYELSKRRLSSGRFGSVAQVRRERGVENYLRARLGAPPAGKRWQVIASKYPERFADYLEGLEL